jgi:hypothetical protein
MKMVGKVGNGKAEELLSRVFPCIIFDVGIVYRNIEHSL